MNSLFSAVFRMLASYGFACVLLLFLMLLTFLGTLEQVEVGLYEAQRKYFDSMYTWVDLAPFRWLSMLSDTDLADQTVPFPLPGVYTLMALLAVNLIMGGMIRVCRTRAEVTYLLAHAGATLLLLIVPIPDMGKVIAISLLNLGFGIGIFVSKGLSRGGILITHVGMALLLGAGAIKFHMASDGHVTLYPNDSSAEFRSYTEWELAVFPVDEGETVNEQLIGASRFAHADGTNSASFVSDSLPFRVEVEHFLPNCRPMPKGPMFEVEVPVIDGFFLKEEPRQKQAEQNIAGAYVAVQDNSGNVHRSILWGLDLIGDNRIPWIVPADGKDWGLELRKRRWAIPFSVRLDEFHHERHARTSIDKEFRSDVTVMEGGIDRPVEISMNEPLRHRGYTFYQASWGPANARPGDPLYSTLAVSMNPSDQYPKYACIVIGFGLLWHFIRKLVKFWSAESRRRVA